MRSRSSAELCVRKETNKDNMQKRTFTVRFCVVNAVICQLFGTGYLRL